MFSKHPKHNNGRYLSGYANRIRFLVSGTPIGWKNISTEKNTFNMLADSNAWQSKSPSYDPAIFPSCEKQLTNATATARFAGGLGIELLTQVII